MARAFTVGLISDTHGLLRPEALDLLRGSDFIVHAGDVGDPQILDELAPLAPVTAVRGNVDTAAWARSLPETAVLEVDRSTRLYVLHRIEDLGLDPAAVGCHAVVFGHTHKPGTQWRDGVLYVNPGSAGRRRFSLPISCGRLHVQEGQVSAELVEVRKSS